MEDAPMTSESVTESETVEPSVPQPSRAVDDRLIEELVSRARAEGLQLIGEGGLLQQLTKRLLESALEGEITDHLGCDTVRNGLSLPYGSGAVEGNRLKMLIRQMFGRAGLDLLRKRVLL